MAKPILRTKPSTLWITAAASILIFCALCTFTDPWSGFSFTFLCKNQTIQGREARIETSPESKDRTFYDDAGILYTVDKPMTMWDEKRRHWLKLHPSFGFGNRILLVTGSQPGACKDPDGDHLLLRTFKNKVDYCRIQGYEIFYNNAFLYPKMRSFWAKIPILKAAMLAHPEVEWLFWIDSDAIFTDMDFKIPFDRYKNHNLVVHGFPRMIYEEKSWVAVNAGVFLMRNCQWSMDLLDIWGSMGPKSPNFSNWGKILRSTLKDKPFPDSDDQSALIYLILKGNRKWRDMIYVENQYSLHGYWLGIVEKYDEIDEKYEETEKGRRRRHAEVVSESYGAAAGVERRPFVTHFTGCQPCSGDHDPAYDGDSCRVGMERALNFADNQVLRNYGFVHLDIGNGSNVTPLPLL